MRVTLRRMLSIKRRFDKRSAALAVALLAGVAVPFAWGAGIFQTYPIIGGAAYCASGNVSGNAQGTITGQGGANPGPGVTTSTVICGQTVPAGPPALTGTEVIPVDLYTPGTNIAAGGPSTAVLPVTAIGGGYGAIQVQTTGATATVSNGIATLFLNGVGATEAVTLTAAPINNQVVRLVNGSAVAITTFSVAANTGQTLTGGGVAPTSLPAQSATSEAGQVAYQYNLANTTWYRIQ
jgi:hypothetical protein